MFAETFSPSAQARSRGWQSTTVRVSALVARPRYSIAKVASFLASLRNNRVVERAAFHRSTNVVEGTGEARGGNDEDSFVVLLSRNFQVKLLR